MSVSGGQRGMRQATGKDLLLLAPALAVVAVLFGGGLLLGLLQALGHLPAAGFDRLTLAHFSNVLTDPDFVKGLLLTLYVALTSTVVASFISVVLALAFMRLFETARLARFIFQIPLAVPHLVIAVAVVFMLSPAGFFSRALSAVGIIESSSAFPLLVNDPWGIGIMSAYIWKEVPFITLMVIAALRSGGIELVDAAKTLKAGPWQRFRYVILPTIFPSLGAAALIVFAFTFGAFEVPYLLGRTYPMMLPVQAYKKYADIDLMQRPEGIATGLVIAVVVTLCIVLSQVITQAARKRGSII